MTSPARDDDGFFSVPGRVVSHDASMGGDVLRGELRQFVGLRVNPAERLHVFEVLVRGQGVGQVHGLVGAPLRRHHNATNLLDLWVVGWADAIQVAGDLQQTNIAIQLLLMWKTIVH